MGYSGGLGYSGYSTVGTGGLGYSWKRGLGYSWNRGSEVQLEEGLGYSWNRGSEVQLEEGLGYSLNRGSEVQLEEGLGYSWNRGSEVQLEQSGSHGRRRKRSLALFVQWPSYSSRVKYVDLLGREHFELDKVGNTFNVIQLIHYVRSFHNIQARCPNIDVEFG